MRGHPLILVDVHRAEQFLLLRRSRSLFDPLTMHIDSEGTAWATGAVGGCRFGVTWLGSGWVFDPVAQMRRAEDLMSRREAMVNASPERHQQELAGVIAQLRLGPVSERLLWLVHQQVLRHRSSLLQVPDLLVAEALWGKEYPSHWRTEIFSILKGMAWLHVADGAEGDFGPQSALLSHVADLRGREDDVCGEGCAGWRGSRHHHILINVGRGFLGVLEQFAQTEDENGVRSYAFPVSGPSRGRSRRARGEWASLRKVGRSGALVSIYLPAKLGDRTACDRFTARQHRLLQAIVREMTRAPEADEESGSRAEVFRGNTVPTISGRGTFACALLDQEASYVGFNGNKVAKGRGYLVPSPGGWMAKAGYETGKIEEFLEDLEALAGKLALIPAGIQRGSQIWLDLSRMTALARTAGNTRQVQDLHLRIYAPSDYLARWNAFFGWEDDRATTVVADDPVLDLHHEMKERRVSQRQLAAGMEVDPSLLSKILRGKKPWPEGWLDRAKIWLNSRLPVAQALPPASGE